VLIIGGGIAEYSILEFYLFLALTFCKLYQYHFHALSDVLTAVLKLQV